jgi:hypothetical protein
MRLRRGFTMIGFFRISNSSDGYPIGARFA